MCERGETNQPDLHNRIPPRALSQVVAAFPSQTSENDRKEITSTLMSSRHQEAEGTEGRRDFHRQNTNERGWVDSSVGKVLVCHIGMSSVPSQAA